MKRRLEKLGYLVCGDEYNAARFGVPQQRRRAWLLCILSHELKPGATLDKLGRDMKRFERPCPPLSSCIDASIKVAVSNTSNNQKGKSRCGEKWKIGFEEPCQIYGKVLLTSDSFNCPLFKPTQHDLWWVVYLTLYLSQKVCVLVLFSSKATLKKRVKDLKQSLGGDFTDREIAVLACAIEELRIDFNIDAMKEVKVIQVDA